MIGHHRVELVAVGEQQVEQISRRPVGGLQARGQQQPQKRVDRFVAELFAVDLGRHQIADDVLGRCGPALLDLFEEVVLERCRRLERALVLDGVADQLHRAFAEPRQVILRQTEQLRDDPGGELEGEVAHQIRFAGLDELVDEPVHDGPHDLGFPPRERA